MLKNIEEVFREDNFRARQLNFIKGEKFMRRYFRKLFIFCWLLLSLGNSYGSEIENHPTRLKPTPYNFYEHNCKGEDGCPKEWKGGRRGYEEYFLARSPVKTQDPLGTCVSFVASAIGEHYYAKQFSEAEFTILVQTDPGAGNQCEGGLFLGKALQMAQKWGFVEERRFTYADYLEKLQSLNESNLNEDSQLCLMSGSNHTNNYNQSMSRFGKPFRLQKDDTKDISNYKLGTFYIILTPGKEVHRDNLPDYIQYHLRRGRPVACAVNIYNLDDWQNPAGRQVKDPSDEEVRGYDIDEEEEVDSHAIVLMGFKKVKRETLFQFKNSWGNNWGDEGYGYLSSFYIKKFATELIAVEDANI